MIELVLVTLIYTVFVVLAAKRAMTYMHVLQQEDYDGARLRKWIFGNKVFDKKLSLGFIVMSYTSIYLPDFLTAFFIFIAIVITIYLEKDPRKRKKKPLVLTDRAKRIFIPTILLCALLSAWVFFINFPFSLIAWPWIIVLQLVPFLLLMVNGILIPLEKVIQKIYWNEAKRKLNTLQPIIIGVTGSFGKTSVKHMLGHILGAQAPTLITPGSVNTVMGITRVIREQLGPEHKYFVVEMGAYGVNSIAELCKLCPPDFAIITAIGHAHYERYRSLDNVATAKYELAQDVLSRLNNPDNKREGKVIVHERTLRFSHSRAIKFDNKQHFIVCGEPPNLDPHQRVEVSYMEKDDVHIHNVEQKAKGLHISFNFDDKIYRLEPQLFGLHHGHNAVLAASCALAMGIDIGKVQIAFLSMPQIAHRLEVRPIKEEGFTIIDDAYNSNPLGFRSALDLMNTIDNGGRKILVTPGMVELGSAHDEVHEQIGTLAGQLCDIAIVVVPDRIPTFIKGFRAGGEEKQVIEVDSFEAAQSWINQNKQENDLILLENDLPDMYEHVPRM